VPEDVFQNLFLDHHTTSDLIKPGSSTSSTSPVPSRAAARSSARRPAPSRARPRTRRQGPGYVMEDADLDAAVDTLMDGATFNSGQCCCGIERIYVHEKLYDAFVEKSVRGCRTTSSATRSTPRRRWGRWRTSASPRRCVRRSARPSQGRRALVDAANFPADDGGAYLAPQILVDVDHSMRGDARGDLRPGRRHHEGVGRRRGARADERLQIRPHRLALDRGCRARRAHRRDIETGTVFMNRADYLDPALCAGPASRKPAAAVRSRSSASRT
jgi:hypothetical protein